MIVKNMGLFLLLGSIIMVFVFRRGGGVDGAPMAYPAGVQPGDQMSGTGPEFFRYESVFIRPPTDEDRAFSIDKAKFIECDVCQVLLENLLAKAESSSQDHILDQFEGDFVEEEIEKLVQASKGPLPDQTKRIAMYKKGCNRHFKDELILKGYRLAHTTVDECILQSRIHKKEANMPSTSKEGEEKEKISCLGRSAKGGSPGDVTTYDKSKEVLYYACEHTLGKFGVEMAQTLSENIDHLSEMGLSPHDTIPPGKDLDSIFESASESESDGEYESSNGSESEGDNSEKVDLEKYKLTYMEGLVRQVCRFQAHCGKERINNVPKEKKVKRKSKKGKKNKDKKKSRRRKKTEL